MMNYMVDMLIYKTLEDEDSIISSITVVLITH